MSNVMRQRIPDRRSSMECVEFLSQMKSGAVLMEIRHGKGQTDKQGLCHRKRSDRLLTTCSRYVLGWAASEEF